MTAPGYVALGISVVVVLFGNGLVTRFFLNLVIASLREDFRNTFATIESLAERDADIESLRAKAARLFDEQQKHDKLLIKLEGVGAPIERIIDRLDKMDERDREQDRIMERTVTTLQTVADALARLEMRFDKAHA